MAKYLVHDDISFSNKKGNKMHLYQNQMHLLHSWLVVLGAILNKEMGIPTSLENIKAKDFSIPDISWTKMDKKKLLRSLQSDFELVYVAQSCLTWEALHHQYRKVKFLTFSNSLFSDNVAGDFQNFQVLLERFLEEERYCYQGKRAWNYVQARFASKGLLQVPKVTGNSFNSSFPLSILTTFNVIPFYSCKVNLRLSISSQLKYIFII